MPSLSSSYGSLGSEFSPLISLLVLLLLLPSATPCQPRLLQEARKGVIGDEISPEIHHHHHYTKDGEIITNHQQSPYPQKPQIHYGGDVESLTGDGGPVRHVVVLQAQPQPQPIVPGIVPGALGDPGEIDEGLFESIFPKKFHPKHFLKSSIHKLRHRFRGLLGDKHHHHHGHHGHKGHKGHHHHHHQPPPPPPPPVQPVYTKVAVPALKVPLVQVEAYQPAYPGTLGGKHHGQKAVAYISPDGFQPAVVVKQKPHLHIPVAEGPIPHHPPPQPQGYPQPHQPVAYHQPQPHQPVAYHQPQIEQGGYPAPQHHQVQQPLAYHQPQPQHHEQQVPFQVQAHQPLQEGYGPAPQIQHGPAGQIQHGPAPQIQHGPAPQIHHQQQSYQPYGTGTGFFGQNSAVGTSPYGTNPFHSSDSSGFADSGIFK